MISVVVPAYNEERNIGRCLSALCHQTIPRDEFEVIVVDGGSEDRTREIAEQYADLVFIQESRKVGGARNDGVMRAEGDVVATTDADCIVPDDWIARVIENFTRYEIVQLYGTVRPIEDEIKHHVSLALANNFSRMGYYTRTLYYTLGCNTAFDREAFIDVGMYQTIDAGDDLEIAQRMRKVGKVRFDSRLKVSFSMRRYEQFGTLKSLYEWLVIVAAGGSSDRFQYTGRRYR
jgi:glycosyltransferase involved in cell wall biosynthesis